MNELMNYFLPVVIGILFGEILCQNNRHLIVKWQNSLEGYLTCAEHSVIYTAFITFFLFVINEVHWLNMYLIGSVFVTHFIIDKFSIAMFWMEHLKDEHSPIHQYYYEQLNKRYQSPINQQVFNNFIEEHKIEVSEKLLNNTAFYITEVINVNLVIHVLTTFVTVCILKYNSFI